MNAYEDGFEPRKPIDYTKIDKTVIQTVKAIENKPHVRFIRYLLTKRYSPTYIMQNLQNLGLSSPHTQYLSAYYLTVIDPLVKKHNLAPLYADYKNKLLRKGGRTTFSKSLLNYRLDVQPNLDMQADFCRFVKEVEVDRLWIPEIYRAHKNSTKNMPVDATGKQILDSTGFGVAPEKIILSPKRYLIDKLILENVPNSRIAKYCVETLEMKGIKDHDIHVYKRYFFNVQAQSIEEKIEALELERESLQNVIKSKGIRQGTDVNDGEDDSIGNRIATIRQNEQRISDLDDNIKTLNRIHSEFTHKQAVVETTDHESMFMDMMVRASRRFQQLDQASDRDVVDPLLKTAKIMELAYNRLIEIKANAANTTDRSSQGVMMELYKRRLDEIANEQLERANTALVDAGDDPIGTFNVNEIMGVDKLGMSYEEKEEGSGE